MAKKPQPTEQPDKPQAPEPINKSYPRRLYHPAQFDPQKITTQGVLVRDPAEEEALGEGWYHSPADFPKKG